MIELYDYQLDAIKKMRNGCILNGGVGSGKSRTSLAYYYICNGGDLKEDCSMQNPKDLYIITTAHKRDTREWDNELIPFSLSQIPEFNLYSNKVVIDSWNNIKKYVDVKNSFFIFDEDRVTGSGAWVKTFLKIAKQNEWIILSATPGDTWSDYIPVFVANGFFKNRTEFSRDHIVYSRFSKYPKIDRYLNTERLIRLRNRILVDMDFTRTTIAHHEDIIVGYDISEYKTIMKTRWNKEKNEPYQNAAELCTALRKLVNMSPERAFEVLRIVEEKQRVIIFYNFDCELELLKNLPYGEDVVVAEWNGHKHQPLPKDEKKWVYLVQYLAGAEGWNCIYTDTIIFYSQSYSYKTVTQACGRIDRLNTPYKHLWYYHIKSKSSIDMAISKALRDKKKFNENKFVSFRKEQ